MRQRSVAGESIELLRGGSRETPAQDDARRHGGAGWQPRARTRGALVAGRARIEEELLTQDVAQGDPDVRTTEQRRADAFVLLAERITSSLGQS
ncbi:MAG: hypothetical protein M3277_03410 [Actinomycetota bacterium]|nr:hypothetical protein [Actinomycetota bacterium]